MIKKVAIVTGASNGIGKAIAQQLIIEEYFVVLADIDDVNGIKLLQEFGTENACFINCNVNNENSVTTLFSLIFEKYKRIDAVVNNAGIIKDNLIWNMTVQDFDDVLNVNLKGTWLMCREAAKIMKEQKNGRIVNIASRAWLGNAGQSNYSSSKAGVVSLTRVLALELGKYNVLVNAVAPGLIDTALTQNLKADVLQKLIQAQPTKTIGCANDIANAVSFLLNSDTRFITGQTIYVDGGKSIGSNF